MANWKRLDPWTDYSRCVGARIRRTGDWPLEGIVTGSIFLGVEIDGVEYNSTPYHTTSRYWVDIDCLPDGFPNEYIMDGNEPVRPFSQDDWPPNAEISNQILTEYERHINGNLSQD